MTARIGVVTFPGTLDDRDSLRAVRIAGAEPVSLWHRDKDLHQVDAVVLAGVSPTATICGPEPSPVSRR